jgi:hypothetical protein
LLRSFKYPATPIAKMALVSSFVKNKTQAASPIAADESSKSFGKLALPMLVPFLFEIMSIQKQLWQGLRKIGSKRTFSK